MRLVAVILALIGLWLFAYAWGQVYQLWFAPLPGDEPIPGEYFTRHRGFIVRSVLTGGGLALGYWIAAAWAWTL